MNDSLLHLYELQKVDSQLDELIDSRGELPERVEEMRAAVDGQRKQLAQVRDEIKTAQLRWKELSAEVSDLRGRIDRWKVQQGDVKNTKEYDAITSQMHEGERKINLDTEAIGRLGVEIEGMQSDEQQIAQDLGEMEAELTEAEKALNEVMANTVAEEKRLLAHREELEKQIQSFHLTIYNRVRPAKAGIAVVAIRNGVCGGCYNAVPRQLALELRKGDKHTVCEYCGRIIVGEPIAVAVDGEPQVITYEMDTEEDAESDE